MNEETRTQPKYRQIANRIAQSISDEMLGPGDALPSITSCATREQVNRSTVKRAYDTLVDAGVIVALQGKGYFVVDNGTVEPEESSDLRIFWSYAHKDDARSGGAITALREAIQAEYELQTGSEANIFQDTKDIGWGMDWRDEIQKSLGVTTFFIPILTPTYLRSPHCLAELRTAKTHFEDLGFPEGIYPIEFVDCAKVIERLADDNLATLLTNTQRIRKWMDLRSEDPNSNAYKKGVREIVDTLLEKEESWSVITTKLLRSASTPDGNEDDGPLEKLADVYESLSQLETTMDSIKDDIDEVGEAFTSTRIQANATPRQAIMAAGKLASRLKRPSENLQSHCRQYADRMQDIDRAIDGLVELHHLFNEGEQSDVFDFDSLHRQIDDLIQTVEEPFAQVDDSRTLIRNFSRLSKVLREPCMRIDAALDTLVSSKETMQRWERRIELALDKS